MKCLVDPFGYHIESFDIEGQKSTEDHQEKWGKFMRDHCDLFRHNANKTTGLFKYAMQEFLRYNKLADDSIGEILDKVKPDVIFFSTFVLFPSIIKSGIPYINVEAGNPIYLWPDVYAKYKAELEVLNDKVAEWLMEKDVDLDQVNMVPIGAKSPFLNLYIYPEDINYVEKGKLEGKFFQIDHAVRKDTEPLNVDLSFVQQGEKLVYLSLGSMGASDVGLIKRLVAMLTKSEHKFVISKGIFCDQFDLAPNMVGVKYVNQIKLLPHVDLVITHGGNNTTIESLYFGKPMIVLPLFGDQSANAERIEEKNLGKKFDPYQVTEDQLLEAIDTLLKDEEVNQRAANIGKKLRSSKKGLELVAFVEKALFEKV